MTSRVFVSPDGFLVRRPASTKKSYRIALITFCRFVFGTDDLKALEKYIKKPDKSKILDDLFRFAEHLDNVKKDGKNLAPNTKKLYIAAVRTYFAMNELVFSKVQLSQIRIKEVEKADDLAFDIDSAKLVLNHLKSLPHAIFLFLLTSGCRIGEALQVTEADIDWNHDPVRVRIAAGGTKTRHERYVFISDECAEYLKNTWLPNRIDYMRAATDRNAGLMKQKTKTAGGRPDIDSDRRFFPVTISTFRAALVGATRRAGLESRNHRQMRRLHPHSTRKFFRTVVGRWGSPDTAEVLMGHEPGLTSSYRMPADSQIIGDYKKAMPYLTLGLTKEARVALETKDMHAAAIMELRADNERLAKEMATLKRIIEFAETRKI